MLASIYLMFFLSGAAALMYEVIWVRSLGLIFGGSHLAVTTVLSVYMAGLALGSYLMGRFSQRFRNLLMLYGLLEIGIALFAIVFVVLTKLYPSIYISLAQGKDHFLFYLSFIRVTFSVIALIIPTTLMGGTLPVLSSFISNQPKDIGRHLSFLYSLNTFGAVAGTIAAGFYFLRFYSVSMTFLIAVLINLVVGVTSIILQTKSRAPLGDEHQGRAKDIISEIESPARGKGAVSNLLSLKLVLWGIGVSGFCALGYEVLWTRILILVVGASVYGFTTMLAAFLTGIALGSKAYGSFERAFQKDRSDIKRTIFGFGATQVLIGLTALLVTYYIRDLPSVSLQMRDFFQKLELNLFAMQQWANLSLAFLYMVVPAFFMGLAFPIAGRVHTYYKKQVGQAVGEVLAYNTIGAILGSTLSGFVLTYIFSIEHSLQMLIVMNMGIGLLVMASLWSKKLIFWATVVVIPLTVTFIAFIPDAFRMWNAKYFAIFRANQPEIFQTPERVKEALENTNVLYYQEGVEAIVSSIKVKGGDQAFITNGRVEASNNLQDQQLQFTLGHLPMLLNKNPEKVLVVGLGSGMTLGATSAHPSVGRIVLIELEPKMIGVARTFKKYNHDVLEHPKLEIIFNDGRNYLLTTSEEFDVITADPIHPWFRGAGYLYTQEYFKLASEHLEEGGVMCQWLPIYELTVENLKAVVKTFQQSFKYTMLWLTYYDSVIVGSNAPVFLDEKVLQKRITQVPAIYDDLSRVKMGSASDFLSYFAMGSKGMTAFGEGGTINTDDNLYLEFSAPLNIGKGFLMKENLLALVRHRESIIPYLVPEEGETSRKRQVKSWEERRELTSLYDQAHAFFLGGQYNTPQFQHLLAELDAKYPWYGPGRFLKNEYLSIIEGEPRLLKQASFVFLDQRGEQIVIELSAVLSRISDEMAMVDIVDNNARIIYGHFNIPGADKEEYLHRLVDSTMVDLQTVYQKELHATLAQGRRYPSAESTLVKIREAIQNMIQENEQFVKDTP